MKRFAFTLESARQLRERQAECEEDVLRGLFRERRALEEEEGRLNRALAEEEHALLRASQPDPRGLAALDRFRTHLSSQRQLLARGRAECDTRIEAQTRKALEARRAVRLLEKLKERRLREWCLEEAKEQENAAAEGFLARWNR